MATEDTQHIESILLPEVEQDVSSFMDKIMNLCTEVEDRGEEARKDIENFCLQARKKFNFINALLQLLL